ncbi:hypothetical protein GCM10025791_27470 [Halioxenophilus aromaticivorans]|uniref:Uncharacterized protein n=1 Tax=Halioxenophilus aromaticivorans TaxID=1306992 RepID=A0AAV3U3M9_9ALTE
MPTFAHFHVRESTRCGLIDVQYNMQVIAHDGIGTNVDGKYTGQMQKPIFNPMSAVLIRFAGEMIFAA